MQKLLFIMNPYAGMRRCNRYLTEILSVFNWAGYQVDIHMTAGPGDGARVVRERAGDAELAVCAGGDGTFNETLTGILDSGKDIPIGYIPCGSTNDFASSLGLSTDVVQAARDIVEGSCRSYDVGRFADRYFSYVASFGAFTRASYQTPQSVKNALGHTAYVLEGIQELSQLRREHIRIETGDRVIEDDFLFGAICNSTSVGGILTLDPKQVDMTDGLFELLLVRSPRDLAEVGECIRALQNQTYNCAMVTFLSTRELTVYADPDMPWTLDGEREPGHQWVEVRNLHRVIRVIGRETT